MLMVLLFVHRWMKIEATTTTTTTKKSLVFLTLLILCALGMTSSTSTSFFAKLEKRIDEVDSHLCVGLDPHLKELFPDLKDDSSALAAKTEQERCDAAYTFCKNLIDATGQ